MTDKLNGNASVSCVRHEGVAILTLSSPPVNALGLGMRKAILEALHQASTDASVQSIVLRGDGRCFSAGGDINEFGTPAALQEPGLSTQLQPAIESCGKPVVAAIHGFALGGGLETALACHYRVALHDAIVGLPEVAIGLIPLSGTQRLPRLIGRAAAERLILSAAKVQAGSLHGTGLFDRVVNGRVEDLIGEALMLAQGAQDHSARRTRDLAPSVNGLSSVELDGMRDAAAQAGRRFAFDAAKAAIDASADMPFEAGMSYARLHYDNCYRSDEFRRLRAAFLAR